MLPNYKRQYKGNFRVSILNKVMDYLGDAVANHFQEQIDQIALKQRDKLNTAAGFRFRGTSYSHHLVENVGFRFKRLLPELQEEFLDHLEVFEAHKSRQANVETAITNALTLMGNTVDLYILLPECIHNCLPTKDAKYGYLNQEKITHFQQEYAKELQQIKLQLIMKTLKV